MVSRSLGIKLERDSSKIETLQMVTVQVMFFFVLGNFGAGGQQADGRELCADFYGFLPALNFHLQCYRFSFA